MAYDEDLANRVREQIAGESAVTQKAMFGGLAFMVSGHMTVGVMGDELIVRLAPDDGDAALDEPDTRPMDMTGRPMRGWIVVGAGGIATDEQLRDWVGRGVAFTRSLPPKG